MRTDAGLVFLPYFRNESAVFNVRTIAVPSFGRVVGYTESGPFRIAVWNGIRSQNPAGPRFSGRASQCSHSLHVDVLVMAQSSRNLVSGMPYRHYSCGEFLARRAVFASDGDFAPAMEWTFQRGRVQAYRLFGRWGRFGFEYFPSTRVNAPPSAETADEALFRSWPPETPNRPAG